MIFIIIIIAIIIMVGAALFASSEIRAQKLSMAWRDYLPAVWIPIVIAIPNFDSDSDSDSDSYSD